MCIQLPSFANLSAAPQLAAPDKQATLLMALTMASWAWTPPWTRSW